MLLNGHADGAGAPGVAQQAHRLKGVARALVVGDGAEREEPGAGRGDLEGHGPGGDEEVARVQVPRETAAARVVPARARLLDVLLEAAPRQEEAAVLARVPHGGLEDGEGVVEEEVVQHQLPPRVLHAVPD